MVRLAPQLSEITMKSITVTDRNGSPATFTVGAPVCFKSDYEQCGILTRIDAPRFGPVRLHIHNDRGFGGEYLRYATDTVEHASDCWID